MEPTRRSSDSGTEQTEFAFESGDDHPNEVQRELSADPDTFPVLPRRVVSPAPAKAAPPVWLQRLWLIVYVTFCIELGLWLIIVPWKQVWHTNSLLASFPTLRVIFENYFVRGLVTGLGFVDLWLGISEAVHYRERKSAPGSHSPEASQH